MAQMPPLRDILNDTPATATDPEWNFNTIETHLSREVINRDGSVAMVSPLSGPTAVNSDEYATLGQVQAVIPAGVMWDYGGSTAPTGWALCDGSAVSTTDSTYAALFAAIGYAYGNPGSGNFNLPDCRDRTTIGKGTARSLGDTGGDADGVAAHTHEHEHTHLDGTLSVDISHGHADTFDIVDLEGAHGHNSKAQEFNITPGTGYKILRPNSGAGTYEASTEPTTGADGGGHLHTLSGSVTNHSSTKQVGGTTAVPNESTTDSTGTSEGNMPPYVVVNKIIKL